MFNKKRNCLIAIIGRDNYYKNWFSDNMNYDVILICYNNMVIPEEVSAKCKYIFRRTGYKNELLTWIFKEIFSINKYDYYFTPDDDIIINSDSINSIFEYMSNNNIHYAQPALKKTGWHCNWGHILSPQGSEPREVHFIECMMPFFSKEYLKELLPVMIETKSLWGFDIYASNRAKEKSYKMICFDNHQAEHIRQQGGISELYAKLKNDGIDASKEMHEFLHKYNLWGFYHNIVRY